MASPGILRSPVLQKPWLLAVLLLLLSPPAAFADGGLSLLSATQMQRTLATLFIGMAEGILLALSFRLPKLRTIGLLVLANYASLLAGGIFIGLLGGILDRPEFVPPLYHLSEIIIVPWIVVFAATLVIEWPFCLRALRGKPGRLWKSAVAAFVLQVLSYAVIVPWYLGPELIGLYSRLRVDPALTAESTQPVTVFFISPDGREVCRTNLCGTPVEQVCAVQAEGSCCRLFVMPGERGAAWDLWFYDGYPERTLRLIEANLSGKAAQWRHPSYPDEIDDDHARPWGRAADLRPETERQWIVEAWKFEDRGIWLRNTDTGEEFTTGLNTPIASWEARNATVLPGDRIVYELHGQIVLLDIPTRRIGFIAMGRSPVVVLPEAVAPTSDRALP